MEEVTGEKVWKNKKRKMKKVASMKNDKRGRRKPRGEENQFFLHESRELKTVGGGAGVFDRSERVGYGRNWLEKELLARRGRYVKG